MKNEIKNSIIKQAISLGFDFENLDSEITLDEIAESIHTFFHENTEMLEEIVDECEVSHSGSRQSVDYMDYSCSGEIVDFSANWRKSPDTKVFHSNFPLEQDGLIKNMRLYYLVGETDYNAPEGYYYCRKAKGHVKEENN